MKKTHCKRGHKYTRGNTRTSNSGKRTCRTCFRDYYRKVWYPKHRRNKSDINHRYLQGLKIEVLTHYGKGKLKCVVHGCKVQDLDMLTLDHVENDGARHRESLGRKGSGGASTYVDLKRRGYPTGHQTLCANHQLKKEIMRCRRLREHSGKD